MVFSNPKLTSATCTIWPSPPGVLSAAADGNTVAVGVGSWLMSLDVAYSGWAVNGGANVRICNPTGKRITLGSGSIRIDVRKH